MLPGERIIGGIAIQHGKGSCSPRQPREFTGLSQEICMGTSVISLLQSSAVQSIKQGCAIVLMSTHIKSSDSKAWWARPGTGLETGMLPWMGWGRVALATGAFAGSHLAAEKLSYN